MNVFQWRSPDFWNWYKSQKKRPSPKLVREYLDQFDAFECYHGCRPENLETYYSQGLRVHDSNSLKRNASRILQVPLKSIEKLDLNNLTKVDKGKIFAVLDGEDLLRSAGHYLIHGSEYYMCVAAQLESEEWEYEDLLKKLRQVGKPTLLRLHVPTKFIRTQDLDQLAEDIPALTWYDFEEERDFVHIDWSFIFKENLPSECVVDHEHPESIASPHHQYRIYEYKKSPKEPYLWRSRK